MAGEIEISLNDTAVGQLLANLKAKIGNLKPVLDIIGEIVKSSVEENFQQGGRYSSAGSWRGGSAKWQDLADSTKKARQRKGKWPGKILVVSAAGLASSITHRVIGDAVHVGTNKVYAAIHQFGGLIDREAGQGTIRHRVTRDGSLMRQEGFPNLAVFSSKKHKHVVKSVSFGPYQIRIPARPFLVVQNEDFTEMQASILEWIGLK